MRIRGRGTLPPRRRFLQWTAHVRTACCALLGVIRSSSRIPLEYETTGRKIVITTHLTRSLQCRSARIPSSFHAYGLHTIFQPLARDRLRFQGGQHEELVCEFHCQHDAAVVSIPNLIKFRSSSPHFRTTEPLLCLLIPATQQLVDYFSELLSEFICCLSSGGLSVFFEVPPRSLLEVECVSHSKKIGTWMAAVLFGIMYYIVFFYYTFFSILGCWRVKVTWTQAINWKTRKTR